MTSAPPAAADTDRHGTGSQPRARRPRPWIALTAALVIAGASGAVGWWAATEALGTPEEAVIEEPPLTVVVGEQTIDQSLRVNVTAQRPADRTVRTAATGVVTSIDIPGDGAVDQGDTLFTIAEQPVVAVRGSTPFYRDLIRGIEGTDVAQAQQLLTDLGHYDGPIDGDYGPGTVAAVRRWQDAIGEERTGVIAYGRLVALGDLPARVRVNDDTLDVGALLSGGEEPLTLVAATPEFSITLGSQQRDLVPLNADVVIGYGDTQWRARMIDAVETELGELRISLQSTDGGSICGDLCDEAVPGGEPVLIPADVIVVPETTGPAIPVGAIRTTPDGTATVQMADGSDRPVTVVESSGGIAIVDGVEAGDEIVVACFDATDDTDPSAEQDAGT